MTPTHTFTAMTVAALVLLATSVDAQDRNARAQGVPPGHLPPAGTCRVWYDGLPPGHQPAPLDCREAERIASRTRGARVVYGAGRWGDERWSRTGDWRDGQWGRATPRRYPNVNLERGRYYRQGPAFDVGYRDGLDKGREDARDRDRYDPARHGRYRSADHGYERRYGSKDAFRDVYRQGFLAGYDEGYDLRYYGRHRR